MILGILRFIKWTLTFFCICLPLMLIGVVLMLFVCPFIPNTQITLPSIFKWWDIVDGWIGRDISVIQKIYAEGWWARYCYIAWRNPINYFDYQILGLHWNGSETYTKYNPDEDNIGDGTRAGFRHIEVNQEKGVCGCMAYAHMLNKTYFEYYWIYVYPFKKDVCFRFRMGWKIGDNKNKPNTTSQWCFVISPIHNYTGK